MFLTELIRDYKSLENKTVTVQGWIRGIRDSKNICFIELNDGTDFESVQIVVDMDVQNFSQITKFHLSSSIEVTGEVIITEGMKQPFEIKASEILLLGSSTEDYPLQKKRHTREFLRQIAHLRPRTNLFRALYRVRNVLSFAIHEFFQERGFLYVHTPIISGFDGEGAGEIFHVTSMDLDNLPTVDGKVDYTKDFFSKPVNLAVTGQLEGEVFAQAFRNIYTFGPTFRADKSNTKFHSAEFWMIEPEMAFCDLDGDMEIAEDMIKFLIKSVLEKCPKEMDFFENFVEKGLKDKLNLILNSEFKRISYTEIINIIHQNKERFEVIPEWGEDIQREHERYIAEEVVKGPLFATDYPENIKAFYMKRNDDGKTVACFDMLVPGIGEIIGGSQREDDLEILREKLEKFSLNEEEYYWYLDLRKYGSTVHSGYGLGFDRFLMYVTGIDNIRDSQPFPRTLNNCEF